MALETQNVKRTEYHSIAKGFRVLNKHSCLPRYAYHKWLLGWCLEGLEGIKDFTVKSMKECIVVVGGDLNEENESMLYSESADEKKFYSDFTKGIVVDAELVFVYFLTQDDMKNPENLLSFFNAMSEDLPYKEAELLLVLPMVTKPDSFDDISNKIQKTTQFRISTIVSIAKNSIAIKQNLTKKLELKLNQYLEDIERDLSALPSEEEDVGESLEKIRAVLERLRKALYFPQQKIERPYNKEQVLKIIERYQEKILYHGFNKKGVRIITTDESVKEDLRDLFSDIRNLEVSISVQTRLDMKPFTDTGVSLHGAKCVYKTQDPYSFVSDNNYSTTGSLVKINGSKMAALTCQHVFFHGPYQSVYVKIKDKVVKLGSNMHSPQQMTSIHDDIALINIKRPTSRIIEACCEKLLLNVQNTPSPADISSTDLYDLNGEIVHKRGACTDLTTGIVIETGEINHEPNFPERASAIIVKPTLGQVRRFGAPGDSGALVFQPSLSLENKLEVIGMLWGGAPQEIFDSRAVICIPLGAAVDKLIQKIDGLYEIDFYKQ